MRMLLKTYDIEEEARTAGERSVLEGSDNIFGATFITATPKFDSGVSSFNLEVHGCEVSLHAYGGTAPVSVEVNYS